MSYRILSRDQFTSPNGDTFEVALFPGLHGVRVALARNGEAFALTGDAAARVAEFMPFAPDYDRTALRQQIETELFEEGYLTLDASQCYASARDIAAASLEASYTAQHIAELRDAWRYL